MKYEVAHTSLQSTKPGKGEDPATSHTFSQGDVVTEADLTGAGFDVDFLKRNGAIEELKGSETDEERNARQQARRDGVRTEPPTTTQDATAGMGQPPKGPGKPTAADEKVGFGDTGNRQLGKEPPADADAARAPRPAGAGSRPPHGRAADRGEEK